MFVADVVNHFPSQVAEFNGRVAKKLRLGVLPADPTDTDEVGSAECQGASAKDLHGSQIERV